VLSACGESLVDRSYRGNPIFILDGLIEVDPTKTPEPLVGEGSTLTTSLFWSVIPQTDDKESAGATFPIWEQRSVTTTFIFPANIILRIFESPRAYILQQGQRSAIGTLIVYLDLDSDSRFNKNVDVVLGFARSKRVFFDVQDAPGDSLSSKFYLKSSEGISCKTGIPGSSTVGTSEQPISEDISSYGCSTEQPCGDGFQCDPNEGICIVSEQFIIEAQTDIDQLGYPFCD